MSHGGQPVKHRQLARQVGERVEDPPASSMASFNFADGAGNFRRFLVDMRPKTIAADPRSGLDKFIDELDNRSTDRDGVCSGLDFFWYCGNFPRFGLVPI
jgi:hypothetical protein